MGENDDTRKAELDPETLELEWEKSDSNPPAFHSKPIPGVGLYTLYRTRGSMYLYGLTYYPAGGYSSLWLGQGVEYDMKGQARVHARNQVRDLIGKASSPVDPVKTGDLELHWKGDGADMLWTTSIPNVGSYFVTPEVDTEGLYRLDWTRFVVVAGEELERSKTDRLTVDTMENVKNAAVEHAKEQIKTQITKVTYPTPETLELSWNEALDGVRRSTWVTGVGRYEIAPDTDQADRFVLKWFPWKGSTSNLLMIRATLEQTLTRARDHARDLLSKLQKSDPPKSAPAEDCQDEDPRPMLVELQWEKDGGLLVSSRVKLVGWYTIGPIQPSGRGPTANDVALCSLARHRFHNGGSDLLADRMTEVSAKKLAAIHATTEQVRALARQAPKGGESTDAWAELLDNEKLPPLNMRWRPRGGGTGWESQKIADAGIYCVIPSSAGSWRVYRDPGDADTEALTDRMPNPEAGKSFAEADAIVRVAASNRKRQAGIEARARALASAVDTLNVHLKDIGAAPIPTMELSRRALSKIGERAGEHPSLFACRRFAVALEKEGPVMRTSTVQTWLALLIENFENFERNRNRD
jgi:hypothetical protein